LDEEELATHRKIPNKGNSGRAAFRNEVVQPQDFYAEGYDGYVDGNPDQSDARETRELDTLIFEPAIPEHPGDGQHISEEQSDREGRGRSRNIPPREIMDQNKQDCDIDDEGARRHGGIPKHFLNGVLHVADRADLTLRQS
jgi:hypothetical protein